MITAQPDVAAETLRRVCEGAPSARNVSINTYLSYAERLLAAGSAMVAAYPSLFSEPGDKPPAHFEMAMAYIALAQAKAVYGM